MKNEDTVTLTGKLIIKINDDVVREVPNLVTTAGKGLIASRLASASDGVITHMAIGTGTTAAAAGDTALVTEVTRQAVDTSGGTVSTNTITYARTFAADDPNITAPATTAVTEAGLFTASSSGTMLARTVFAVVNKGEADSMTISWVITIS